MPQHFRIAIANVDPTEHAFLRDCLAHAGHQVVLSAQTHDELIQLCKLSSPDLILGDIESPGMGGLEAIATYVDQLQLPMIVMCSHCDDEFIERANACGVLAYVIKPVREVQLVIALSVAVQRFHELATLRDELSTLRGTLADRKVIERAKGIVMRKRSLEETSAFQYLQNVARSHRQKLADVARGIVLAEEALDQGPRPTNV